MWFFYHTLLINFRRLRGNVSNKFLDYYFHYPLKVFSANSDDNDKLSSSVLDEWVSARFIKILPRSWSGRPCMRLEICGHSMGLSYFIVT